jgi:hypothetical protein
MVLRRYALSGAVLFAVLFLICGVAFAAKSYPDRVGDVKGGTGPDIANGTSSGRPCGCARALPGTGKDRSSSSGRVEPL